MPMLGRFRETFLREYRRQRGLVLPDPMNLTQDQATSRKPTQRIVDDLVSVIKNKDPRRYARMRGDMAWTREQLIRLGYDPELARWLI